MNRKKDRTDCISTVSGGTLRLTYACIWCRDADLCVRGDGERGPDKIGMSTIAKKRLRCEAWVAFGGAGGSVHDRSASPGDGNNEFLGSDERQAEPMHPQIGPASHDWLNAQSPQDLWPSGDS